MEIIKERTIVETFFKELEFTLKGEERARFSFPFTDDKIVPSTTIFGVRQYEQPCSENECPWWSNYLMCLSKEKSGEMTSKIVTLTHRGMEPAIAECDCGEVFTMNLDRTGACACPRCGQEFNAFGQRLIPNWRTVLREEDY